VTAQDERACCVAKVSVYSGRPDPQWRLRVKLVDQLRRVWLHLGPRASDPPGAPALGYRGITLRCSSGEEWVAFGGAVTHRDADGRVEHRNDPQRRFERRLLAGAPKDVVPSGIPGLDELRDRSRSQARRKV
jgi:hypothetical protein